MLRIFLTCMLASACALAQVKTPQAAPTATPQTSPNTPTPVMMQPVFHPENVGPDTVVIEIQGVCAGLGDGVVKKAPCVTRITKNQFQTMMSATNIAMPTTAAQRSFAESYIQLLAMADAAEKAGVDKDPQFLEQMKLVRMRTIADFYKRVLETRANNPSPDEIAAYYKQNSSKFEQIKIERVIIPTISGRRISGTAADAAKKVKDLANSIRERAVNGEDMNILQADAYKTLGMPAPPPADLGSRRRGTLPPAIESELFALKPGEVTPVEVEPAGFTIYRLRTRDLPSMDSIRAELLHDMHQQYVSSTMKAIQDNARTNLNLDYFVPYPAVRGPVATHPAHSAPTVPRGAITNPVASPTPVTAPK